jgi:SAM-dependent methyltransferase
MGRAARREVDHEGRDVVQVPAIDVDSRRAGIELVLASFVVLFQELAFIRWLGGEVRVLAYFPNVVLISAFLGLGVGCLLARRRIALLAWWPPLVVLLVVVANALRSVAFTQESVTEHLWLLYYDLPKDAPIVQGVRTPILVLFVLSAATFIPLGQFVADRLRRFRAGGRSLAGYACDLAGSLLGAIAFAVVSFAGTKPAVWFLIIGAIALLLLRRFWIVGAVSFAAIVLVVLWVDRADEYSPYYALRRVSLDAGFLVLANGSQHQYAAPLRKSDPLTTPRSILLRDGYHLPYRLLRTKPRRVLVLGAGTGNDVAVALDEGAERVDAVEIDPRILAMGKRHHPDRPYDDPRAHMLNTDARSFLNNSKERYDLIVFGTLDSMTRLSALSNVRLDNFVYTKECLAAARAHLSADGGIALYFGSSVPYIDQRMRAMIAAATGRPPAVVARNFGSFNQLYLGGPAFAHLPPAPIEPGTVLPSDDWPYLYLARRALTPFYASVIAAIALIAVVSVGAAERRLLSQFDAPMFFFGLSFLLLESKAVTEMNLIWGSTWLTSAVVFGSILLMVLAGTLFMHVRPFSWKVSAIGLVLALAINFLTPVHAILSWNLAARLALSILFVGLPIFFASTCFALQFRDEGDPGLAFGWNLLGAVAGGLLEFTSMVIGLRLLAVVALCAYLAAFAMTKRTSMLPKAAQDL